MNNHTEAEENPRRRAFRRAVIANINRSTALRQQRHIREQQIQERERQQLQRWERQNWRTTAAPAQVVHNQQEVIRPTPVASDGSSGPSLIGNLKKVAEATPNVAFEYPISSWTILSFDLNYDPTQAKGKQPEIEPRVASSSNSKGKQPQQPRHNINQWLDGRPRPALDPRADEWLPLIRTVDQDNQPLDRPNKRSSSYDSDSLGDWPDSDGYQSKRRSWLESEVESRDGSPVAEWQLWSPDFDNLDVRSDEGQGSGEGKQPDEGNDLNEGKDSDKNEESNKGKDSKKGEESDTEDLKPHYITPVDSRDGTPVNPLARVPLLDRGPSIRLQKALAEDQDAPRKPICDLFGSSEPLPPATQNGLLKAAEWAGVCRSEVREPSMQAKMAMLGPERSVSEMELEWSLWAGLKRPRKKPAYLPRLEEKHEEEFPSALRREQRRLMRFVGPSSVEGVAKALEKRLAEVVAERQREWWNGLLQRSDARAHQLAQEAAEARSSCRLHAWVTTIADIAVPAGGCSPKAWWRL
ncbi:hypothetical protein BDP81DRAFT_411063 [Colletotrichum phormii]|uniref:Uncharacterized protein n=1 Tax=Colletotrichum phormii TaxID=359342 RepID=A0AAI9ZGK9_9PEZI|nr:uncharacterized protein BDP81DRAFT_411063 [Colletotrichum phormii]KAK1622974.1 hypothetical protein BDP81DRAFT_411063 [Colletotrichum phormii]